MQKGKGCTQANTVAFKFSLNNIDAMEVGNYREGIQLCNKALKKQPDLHIAKVWFNQNETIKFNLRSDTGIDGLTRNTKCAMPYSSSF